MDIALIILAYIKELAWPAIVVFSLFLLREPISYWIQSLKYFKAKLFGIELEGGGESADEEAKRLETEGYIDDVGIIFPTDKDYIQAGIESLEEKAESDPDVQLFIGVYRGNKEMMRKALESGASTRVTNIQILKRYQHKLSSATIQAQIKRQAYKIAQERAEKSGEGKHV